MISLSAKQPLFLQFKRNVLEELKKRNLKEGDKIPSENEFRRDFDISIRTVRRALLELEKDGVLVRCQGRGTFLKKLKPEKTASKIVGMLFSSMDIITRPSIADYLNGIEKSCEELNLRCRMYPVGRRFGDNGNLESLDRIVPLSDINGAVILSPLKREDILLLRKQNTAFVAVHKYHGFNVKVAATDYSEVASLAVNHLAGMGHKKIAFITGYSNPGNEAAVLVNDNLAEKASELAAELNISIDIKFSDHTEQSGYTAAMEVLNSGNPPTALFAIDESLTRGAANAIFDKELKIPEDVALLGSGNLRFSSINIPSRENGRNAIAMLNEIISGKQPEKCVVITHPELIVRSSTNFIRKK